MNQVGLTRLAALSIMFKALNVILHVTCARCKYSKYFCVELSYEEWQKLSGTD